MMAVLALLAGLSFLADAALAPSYYTSESVLMTGKWVKIKVRNTGMHQITDEQLREMGFSDPSKVAVYGYSGLAFADNRLSSDIPDDLPPVPVARHNGKLIFMPRVMCRCVLQGCVSMWMQMPRRLWM